MTVTPAHFSKTEILLMMDAVNAQHSQLTADIKYLDKIIVKLSKLYKELKDD